MTPKRWPVLFCSHVCTVMKPITILQWQRHSSRFPPVFVFKSSYSVIFFIVSILIWVIHLFIQLLVGKWIAAKKKRQTAPLNGWRTFLTNWTFVFVDLHWLMTARKSWLQPVGFSLASFFLCLDFACSVGMGFLSFFCFGKKKPNNLHVRLRSCNQIVVLG